MVESKKIMLDILDDVASFCDNNNIIYYLAYGTLIGAVRHKGFIPWDDDIDIMMPRPDYEKFVLLYHEKGKYAISTPLIDNGCFLVYSKVYDKRTAKYENGVDYNRYPVLGIDIDVFPLDGLPNNIGTRRIHKKLLSKIGALIIRTIAPVIKHNTFRGKIAGNLLYPLCRSFGKDFFINMFIRFAKKYKYEDSDLVHVAFPLAVSKHESYSKSSFSQRTQVPFENCMFWAPEGYHEILTSYYGDYMVLPPKEKRCSHHVNKAYWK